MHAPVMHILPLATIVRRRELPIPGRVTARVGQRVSPNDVVAETTFAREHLLINVARQLGVKEEDADRLIKVKKGDKVARETVLADMGGLAGREVLSPIGGRVVVVGGGQILLESGDAAIELKAGIPGVVTEVIAERGVQIQAAGTLVQGVWGNGRAEYGVMLNLLELPDSVLQPGQMDVSMRGSVVLGGYVGDARTLQAAAEMPARALVISSLNPELIPACLQLRFPVVVLEGFGRRALNPTAFKLLTTNAKREAAVNADVDIETGMRPEIIIPLPVSQEPPIPRDSETFAPGQIVRLRRAPFAGEIGTMVDLRPGLTPMPSGLRLPAANVRLASGEVIPVPLVNLEVLA